MLRIYNTLSRGLEEFKSIEEGKIRFYHCGPTVYWTQHIGNMRGMMMADLIRRSLTYLGYEVNFVRNYTDVGHLTGDNIGDADIGEDRMEKGAKREGLTPDALADKYIQIFEADIAALNMLSMEELNKPRASKYVPQMQEMIQVLIDKGFAYETDWAVYFDVTKFPSYNELNRQNMEQNTQGAGSGEIQDPKKKHAADFALWVFKTATHKNALQTWPSPFHSSEVENGEGFPGWHIECSAMSKTLLGDTLDIHMGGIEHISIHHTNEIAQSEAANEVKFVNYWLHNEHLTVNGKKMAKSEGTAYSLSEVVEKGYSPLDLRYFFLTSQYRSKQNFSWEALKSAKIARDKLRERVWALSTGNGIVIPNYKEKFVIAIENDFNIPQALAVIWDLVKSSEKEEDIRATILDFDQVLGLNLEGLREVAKNMLDTDDLVAVKIKELVETRNLARQNKDWAKSDELRVKIEALGYQVEDTKSGTQVSVRR